MVFCFPPPPPLFAENVCGIVTFIEEFFLGGGGVEFERLSVALFSYLKK